MCAGCSRDKQRKVQMLDMEMLTCSVNNEILSPYWNTEQNLLALKLSKKNHAYPPLPKKLVMTIFLVQPNILQTRQTY